MAVTVDIDIPAHITHVPGVFQELQVSWPYSLQTVNTVSCSVTGESWSRKRNMGKRDRVKVLFSTSLFYLN